MICPGDGPTRYMAMFMTLPNAKYERMVGVYMSAHSIAAALVEAFLIHEHIGPFAQHKPNCLNLHVFTNPFYGTQPPPKKWIMRNPWMSQCPPWWRLCKQRFWWGALFLHMWFLSLKHPPSRPSWYTNNYKKKALLSIIPSEQNNMLREPGFTLFEIKNHPWGTSATSQSSE